MASTNHRTSKDCVYTALEVPLDEVTRMRKRTCADHCAGTCRLTTKLLFSFILGVLLLVLVPLGILLLSPLYLFRWIVSKLAPIFKPSLAKILNTRGATLSVDNVYGERGSPTCNLFVLGVVDGKLPLHVFFDRTQSDVISAKNPDGSLVNPEMQQYITTWMGYHFWHWEEDFRLEDHVHMYNGEYLDKIRNDGGVNDETMRLMCDEFIRTPFKPGKSPWEAYLLHDIIVEGNDMEKRPKSGLVLRIHHCLADGFAVLKLITKDLMSAQYERAQAAYVQRSLSEKVFGGAWLLLKCPFEGAWQIIDAIDVNDWHVSESKLKRQYHIQATGRIPLDYLKSIKNAYATSFNTVLFACMAAGIRRSMIENGVKVPRNIHCLTPLPWPGHPDKLRNHLTLCVITLPVGEPNSMERMRVIREDLERQRSSSIPITLFILGPLFGALPAWLIKATFANYATTTVLTSMPGPDRVVDFLGCALDDVVFGGGLLAGNCGVGLSSLSYNNAIRIGAGFDKAILDTPQKVEQVVQYMVEELEFLKKMAANSNVAKPT